MRQWYQRALPYVAFALVVFGAKLLVVNSFGNATPYWDQWDAEADNLYRPWVEGSLRWHDLLIPHSEHRIFTTRILALLLFELNGRVWDPLLQMIVNAGLHVLALLVLVYFLRPSGTERAKVLFFSFTCIVFSMPYGWENTLAGFQSQFYFLLLFSFVFLWCVVQYESSGRLGLLVGMVACAALSFFSLASGALTIAAGAGTLGTQWIVGVRRNRRTIVLISLLFASFVVAVVLTPMIDGHAALKAQSLSHYKHAVFQAMSWPAQPVLGLFIYTPMVVFMVWQLCNWHISRPMVWFVFAMCLWVTGQIMSIAYGRAVGILSSRYLDVFSIGLIVNFVCILILKEYYQNLTRLFSYFLIFWLLLVVHGFAATMSSIISELQAKQYTGTEQEKNVRGYLTSGDFSHLENKPFLHIPYPKAERLKTLLDDKVIKAFLPGNLSQPLSPSHVDISGLVLDTAGYYPTTPELPTGRAYGTYNSQGDIAQGFINLEFDNKTSTGVYNFLLSGYPTQSGMSVSVKDALGHKYTIKPDHDPKESWASFYLLISRGAFSVFLEDRSPSSWVAISNPIPEGKMASQRSFMLLSGRHFLTLGVVLLLAMLGGEQQFPESGKTH